MRIRIHGWCEWVATSSVRAAPWRRLARRRSAEQGGTAAGGRRAHYTALAFEHLDERVLLATVGVGLDAISDSSPTWVFNDAFLESRDWIAQAYDTVTGAETWGGGGTIAVDANDWVTQLTQWTAGNGDLMQQRAGTLMFRDINGNYPAGIYTAQWQGTGSVVFGFDAQVISQSTGTDGTHYAQLRVTPSSAGIYLEIASTSSSDPVRNIHVWMPDANGNAQIGQVWTPGASFSPFTPQFLAELQSFNTLRFMDWMSTNTSSVVNWSDRRPLTYARQSGGNNGVSYEYIIELANELNKNIWINLPYQSNDNFNTQLATLVKSTLKLGLSVYVEWSNEVWNGQFNTANWITTELALPQYSGLDRNQFIAMEESHDYALWSQVFAGQTNRLIRVVAGQAADPAGTDEILANMGGQFDMVSTAAYVTLTSAQTASFTAATTGDNVLNAAFADLPTTIAELQSAEALAVKYSSLLGRSIGFVAYEGGQQLSANGQTVSYQQALYDAQVNPRMYGLYKQLITQFTAMGGSLFMHYSNISTNSKFGSYGALQYLGQPASQAPKYQALLDAMSGTWAIPTSAPPAPTQLSTSIVSNNSVLLSWSDVLGYEDGFKVEMSTDGVNFTQIAVLAAGSLSYTATGLSLSTTYTFRVRAYNAFGNSAYSNTSASTTGVSTGLTSVDFSAGFANSASLLTLNGSAAVVGSNLVLTNGGLYQSASAFTTNLVSVATFSTQFSFQLLNPSADGFTFTLQGMSPTAIGGVGGSLGYAADAFSGGHLAITNSIAIKFDLASNSGEGSDSTGMYVNGATPTNAGSIDLSSSGIDLHSGHVFNVVMTYDGTTLVVTITDATTGTSAQQSYAAAIGSSAYVGFTAGTGGMSATQQILNWKFTTGYSSSSSVPAPPSNLVAKATGTAQVNLTWTDNATNESGFAIERMTGTGGTFVQIAKVGVNATSFIDTSVAANTQYTYRVRAMNSNGASGYSNQATVVVSSATTSINFASGFTSSTGLALNGSAAISNSALVLTNGASYQSASAFTSSLVSVSAFSTQFSFQLLNPSADGFTFTIQNVGPTALGGVGGNLGYSADGFAGGHPAITSSIAIKFDLASNNGEGNDSTGLYINGATPTNVGSIDLTSTGIDLHSGHVFNVAMTYDGTTLIVTTTDATTGAKAVQSYAVSIGPTAYVGFTAGTGGLSSTQKILNWTFTSGLSQIGGPAAPTNLAATVGGNTQVNLAWTDNSTNETGFKIQRAVGNGAFVLVATVGANVTSWKDTSVAVGTQYSYEVSATNANGDSSASNVATITVPTVAVNDPTGFASASGLTLNGSAAISSSALVLTNGGLYQSSSAFTSNLVNVAKFNTQFTFQ
ncbi:MAG TPA: fibronectin type III domain-containing protein, partial [Pirellulales bacterium]|nr:fibronectin type III domain-containing protein [Pirellulales bacterium]